MTSKRLYDYQEEKPSDGSLLISPSMITTYQSCQRLWYITYILGIRSEPSEAQKLGLDVHAILEAYYKHLTPCPPTKAGKIAASGIHTLPKEDTVLGIEKELFFKDASKPYWFRGIVDLVGPLGPLDHKTTSNFRWAKTPEELREDPQAIIYTAIWKLLIGHLKLPNTFKQAQWTYFLTNDTPRAKAVKFNKVDSLTTLYPITDEIFGKWDKIIAEPYPDQFLQDDLCNEIFPCNTDHCPRFKGCPHRAMCGTTVLDSLFKKEEKVTTIQERMEEIRNNANDNANRSDDASMSFDEYKAKNPDKGLLALKKGYAAYQKSFATTETSAEEPMKASTEDTAAELAAPVNPPEESESQESESSEVQTSQPDLSPRDALIKAVSEGLPQDRWKSEYKRLGGSRFTQKFETELYSYAPKSEKSSVQTSVSFVLYVDCYPLKKAVSPIMLFDFLKPFIEQIESENSYPFWAATQYGKGDQQVSELLMSNDSWPESIYCEEYATPKHVLMALISMADEVVKKC